MNSPNIKVPYDYCKMMSMELPLKDVLRALYRIPVKDDADEYVLVKALLGEIGALDLYGMDPDKSKAALEVLTSTLWSIVDQSVQKSYIIKELVTCSHLLSIEKVGIPISQEQLFAECNQAMTLYKASYEELYKMAAAENIVISPENVSKRFAFPAEMTELNTLLSEVRKLWKHTLLLDYERLSKHISNNRLYCKWENYAAVSGRIQSHDPNVQGFPKVVRESCIVPSPGNVLIKADYVSEELVVMAILAKDMQLLQDIRSGVDLHARMASVLFNKPIVQVTDSERKLCKHMTFATLYGAGANTIKEMADDKLLLGGLTGTAIQRIIKKEYPAIRILEEKSKKCKQIVFIDGSTMELSSIKKQFSAVNRMIQGSGSIILKQVIANLVEQLPKEANVVCLIHDEVIVETPACLEEETYKVVTDVMSNVLSNFKIKIKMPVDVARIGENLC